MLVRFIREWNGHQPDKYQYIEDLQADILIRQGIAEHAYKGDEPQKPHNFIEWPQKRW